MNGKMLLKLARPARDESGSILVEAALIMPTFLLLCLGLITLTFYVNSLVTLTAATTQAVRVFAYDAPVTLGSTSTTVSSTPYTDVQNTLLSARYSGLLPSLNAAPAASGGITIVSLCVFPAASTCAAGGTTCNSDSTCSTALANATKDFTNDPVASLSTSYPCFVAFPMFGLSSCTLTWTASYPIQ